MNEHLDSDHPRPELNYEKKPELASQQASQSATHHHHALSFPETKHYAMTNARTVRTTRTTPP